MNKQKANFHFISSCIQINNKLILLKIAELHCIKEKKSNRRVRTRIEKGPCVKAKRLFDSRNERKCNECRSAQSPHCGSDGKQQNRPDQFFFTYACLSESFDVEERTFEMVTTSDNI